MDDVLGGGAVEGVGLLKYLFSFIITLLTGSGGVIFYLFRKTENDKKVIIEGKNKEIVTLSERLDKANTTIRAQEMTIFKLQIENDRN